MKQGFAIQNIFSRMGDYFLIFVIIVLALSLFRNFKRIGDANNEVLNAQKRVEKKEEENRKLEENLEKMRSEAFIEKQLRDTLGLAKEGEIIVILPEDEIVRKFAPKIEKEEDVLPDPNWKKWLLLFL